jgi:hypothetical protein
MLVGSSGASATSEVRHSRRASALLFAAFGGLLVLGLAGSTAYLWFAPGPVTIGPWTIVGPSCAKVWVMVVTSPRSGSAAGPSSGAGRRAAGPVQMVIQSSSGPVTSLLLAAPTRQGRPLPAGGASSAASTPPPGAVSLLISGRWLKELGPFTVVGR